MNKIQRVKAAIAHKPTDKVPKGEVWIDGVVCNRLLNKDYPNEYQIFQRDYEVRKLLNIDLINVGDWPFEKTGKFYLGREVFLSNYGYEFISDKSKHVTKPPVESIEAAYNYKKPKIENVNPKIVKDFSSKTDLFVFAQIGGPVSMLDEMFDMSDFMVHCLTNTKEMTYLAEKVMEYEVEKAKLFLDNGAHGILIADDIAFNSGLLLPPNIMAEMVYPFYKYAVKEIKKHKNVPVFAHTDGNINEMLEQYVEFGFDGLQSLQPSAKMDLRDVKKRVGNNLCLWGNIDIDYIMSFAPPHEVYKNVSDTIKIGIENGGFILSTCNTITDSMPSENIFAMMQAAEDYKL